MSGAELPMRRRMAMNKLPIKSPPSDHAERLHALDEHKSVIVSAPAGSGKTTLLAQRFLTLLATVEEPGQVVAITFTEAAAAEMRNRVLDELRKDEPGPIAQRALDHSQILGWNLLDLPSQLRIQTIDSFCRDLALQQPLLACLGGSLEIASQPAELYRQAARSTLRQLGGKDHALSESITALLLWRDNNWGELEDLLVEMLKERDRWMQDFVFDRDPEWPALRQRLERSFARAHSASTRYTDHEWEIVRACFGLLRRAAAELHVVFGESGLADFTEVAQIALSVLRGTDGQPTDAAAAVADRIRHLLVDEFQDTSRRQHQLLAHLIAAWPDREDRTCFVVGDPMQSIYFFRDADAELFPRVERLGLELPGELPFKFDPAHLTANFRSAPRLVESTNEFFTDVFAADDGSGVAFTRADAERDDHKTSGIQLVASNPAPMQMHLEFIPQSARGSAGPGKAEIAASRATTCEFQVNEIVALIQSHLPRINAARDANATEKRCEKDKFRVAVLGRTRKALAPIAAALREATIPFRAVDLEALADRPEIIDALALARALLNPQDRVAWLGVLRAPWSGLSLADLYALVSDDSRDILVRPVPDLLSARLDLLSKEGRTAAQRVLGAIRFAGRMRIAQPTASTGTWLEQVWLQLGGARCVDAAARANLNLLWSRIDGLPAGEQDLLGPALDLALKDLKAQPDPGSGSGCGVQLMTIHQSKGLEFEVVIVPELHVPERHSPSKMLSWLERGLAEPDESWPDGPGEITEFLVAPIQSKGSDRGGAKEFVDRARSERESQELRRLLYVAATRAREELHFFARPEYKTGKNGSLSLSEPKNSLLATAWPGFQNEIHRRFDRWAASRLPDQVASATIDSIAASAPEIAPAVAPEVAIEAPAATLVRRLPIDFSFSIIEPSLSVNESPLLGAGKLYERHEGGLLSRALGVAVHALLQNLSRLLAAGTRPDTIAVLPQFLPRITSQIRAMGADPKSAGRIAQQALEIAGRAANDQTGRWILGPHLESGSEVRWAGVISGKLRTVQVDRTFRAGATPGSEAPDTGAGTWWIVDYKTVDEGFANPDSALVELRRRYAPQLEAYAEVLCNLREPGAAIHAGLYYPRMSLFDWWEI
jgi:ATP-dependent helicase/nuclease subunit A